MRGLPVTFWIWLGYIHADDQQHVFDIAESNITDITEIPLYANLKEIELNPDGSNEEYTLEGDGIPPLPVGLDFQILSVNAGMFFYKLTKVCNKIFFQLRLAMK